MSNACMWKNNPEIKFLRMNVLKVVPFICCSGLNPLIKSNGMGV